MQCLPRKLLYNYIFQQTHRYNAFFIVYIQIPLLRISMSLFLQDYRIIHKDHGEDH